MLQALADAVDELDIPIDGESIAQVLAIRDRLDARLNTALDAYDAARLWELDHATSLNTWLAAHGCTKRTANLMTARMRKVRSMPIVTEQWRGGGLSTGQVDAIAANVSERTAPLFAAVENEMVELLRDQSVADTANAMRLWAEAARDALQADPATTEDGDDVEAQALYLSRTLAGRGELTGSLDTETRELLEAALDIASVDDRNIPAPQRRADALAVVSRFFLDHHDRVADAKTKGRQRPHLNLVVNAHTQRAETVNGDPIPKTVLERLCCDAVIHEAVIENGQVLHYGKAKRTVPPHLFHAVTIRDRGCRFPDCDRPPKWTEAHHVVPWDPNLGDGPTDIENIALLCSRHHHLLHKPGWHAKLLPDGTLEVTDPSGRTRTSRPPGNYQPPLR